VLDDVAEPCGSTCPSGTPVVLTSMLEPRRDGLLAEHVEHGARARGTFASE